MRNKETLAIKRDGDAIKLLLPITLQLSHKSTVKTSHNILHFYKTPIEHSLWPATTSTWEIWRVTGTPEISMPCPSKLVRGLGPRSAGGERGGCSAQRLRRNGQDPDVSSEEDDRINPVTMQRNLQRFGQDDWTVLTKSQVSENYRAGAELSDRY